MKTTVLIGLSYGDEAKSKCTYSLLKADKYTHGLRFNGGSNCGHTLIHNGSKVILHTLPTSVMFDNMISIIGSGCVISVKKLFDEINEINKIPGINVNNKNLKIAYNTHIVQDKHIIEESNETAIGTTKQGIGPCYRDKYARIGIRAEHIPELKPFLVDLYQEFSSSAVIDLLCEGGQGFYLDIDHCKEYPYCTSSHTTVAGALLNSIPYHTVKEVYGIAKVYSTYVGSMNYQPSDMIFDQIQIVGKEIGATTGRKRACSWLDLNELKKAIDINGVTTLVLNKVDVFRELDYWCLLHNNQVLDLNNEENYKTYIQLELLNTTIQNIIWSDNPEGI